MRRLLVVALLLGGLTGLAATPPAARATASGHHHRQRPGQASWVTAWGAASSSAFPIGYNTDRDTLAHTAGSSRTIRMVVRPTLGGDRVRLRLSNALSSVPLTVGAIRVARTTTGAATRGPSPLVRIAGGKGTTIAPGATVVTDPVPLHVRAGHDVAVSIEEVGAAPNPSVHSQAFRAEYVSPDGSGDVTDDAEGRAFAHTVSSVLVLDRLDVRTSRRSHAIVVLGDSLSDGVGATFGGHDRWTDDVGSRLRARHARLSVVDEGLTGNGLDCPVGLPQDGPSGLSRLHRDVLSAAGIGAVWVFEGTNDLANFCTAAQVETSLTRIAAAVHRRGLPLVVSTIIPREDAHFPATAEAQRRLLNRWIRKSSPAELVVDFDRAVRARDGGFDPRYDSGDHTHLNPAGYRVLARSVPLGAVHVLAAE